MTEASVKVKKQNNNSVIRKAKGFDIKKLINSVTVFLNETKAELRKVTWLNRRKLFIYFVIVVVITVAITLFVSFIDVIIAELFKMVKEAI